MSTRDPILMPLFAVAALMAACQTPPAADAPGASLAVIAGAATASPPAAAAVAPATPAAALPPSAAPTAGTPRPARPRDGSPTVITREAAVARAKVAGIDPATQVTLMQADNHEFVHEIPTANRVWVIRNAAKKSVCVDANTGEILAK